MSVNWFSLVPGLRHGGPWQPDIELQSDEWERPEPEPQISEPRYAPPRVQWTKAAPVVPGLYAVKVDAQAPRRVVEVYRDKRGRLMASWTDIPEFEVNTCGFLFGDHTYMEPR